LSSGEVLVGNIGSRRRFNYTVIGDTVNLAARLESANTHYGTSVLASETTVAIAGNAFTWREIDLLRVKGRVQPVHVYEPLAAFGQENAQQTASASCYAQGLARWRARDFTGAAQSFAAAGDADMPSRLFAERAKALAHDPPGPEWAPITTLDTK
jgi:adenylate cyclase